jgi:hypothetical protein
MAIKVSVAVWDAYKGEPGHKLVLLALADYANNSGTGIVHPSLQKLAAKTCLSYSAVKRAMSTLIDDGWLAIRKHANEVFVGSAREYQLNFKRLNIVDEDADGGVTQTPPGGQAEPGGGVITLPPDQYGNKDGNITSDPLDIRLAEAMLAHIRKLNPNHKPPNLPKWATIFSLMRRIDKRSPEDIESLMAWVYEDDFWRGNILSPDKLRKHYDRLVIKRNAQKGSSDFEPGYFR